MESTPLSPFSLRIHTTALTVCPNEVFLRSAAPAASGEKEQTPRLTHTEQQRDYNNHSLNIAYASSQSTTKGYIRVKLFQTHVLFYTCIMIWISVVDPALVIKSSGDVTLWIISDCFCWSEFDATSSIRFVSVRRYGS